MWQLPSGPGPREFAWSNFGSNPVAISPDGKLLAVAEDSHGPLHLRAVASGQRLRTLSNTHGQIDYLAFAADGQLIVAARRDKVRLWKTFAAGESPWREFPVHGGVVYAVALTGDGRTLITAGKDKEIRLWELATSTRRRSLSGHDGAVLALAVSPDGGTLVSAGEDGKVLLHSLTPRGEPLAMTNRDRLWEQLALHDAAESGRAALALLSSPRDGVELLGSRLRPVPKLDEKQVREQIDGLDALRFSVRTQASNRLETLGLSVAPALRRTLKERPTLEVRRRIERLLEAMEDLPLSPEELRADRAIELLEQLATPEARRLLQRLAGGALGARQTEAAQAALRRLSH